MQNRPLCCCLCEILGLEGCYGIVYQVGALLSFPPLVEYLDAWCTDHETWLCVTK